MDGKRKRSLSLRLQFKENVTQTYFLFKTKIIFSQDEDAKGRMKRKLKHLNALKNSNMQII